MRAELAAIFCSRSQRDWVAIFDAVDCCVTPVLRLEESLEDAQLQARGMVVEVGGVRQFGPAVRMTAMPSAAARAAPTQAGADTDAILASAGVDAETIERLRAAGVI